MAKKAVKAKAPSKSEILTALSEKTGHSRKDSGAFLDALEGLLSETISSGAGIFVLPGLLKVYIHTKKATGERMGINPRTGERQKIEARPETKVVKVKALKRLKDLI
ncbi:MAG: HU family DNA-binding protein [Planctomycetota bacterium]